MLAIDEFLKSTDDSEWCDKFPDRAGLQLFLEDFAQASVPSTMYESMKSDLDDGLVSVFAVIGTGALALTWFQVQNYIGKVSDGETSSRANMGGRWSKKAARGSSGVGKSCATSYDKEGVDMHNRFWRFLNLLKEKSTFATFESECVSDWKERRAAERTSKRRKRTNEATEGTEMPEFDLFDGFDGFGNIDTTGAGASD